ncbi:MAG: tRNA (guanosine(37)-N1)-methyltransferase TrmD [Chloroflexi bacterium]|nr:tRNA (guanosine(37)-N1)-methyltransferase TrmD [Chloroflexota bacterium]
MRIHILTLFPDMFIGPLDHSIVQRATQRGIAHIETHNIRDYATDKHRITDDYLHGGGSGMLLKPEPIFRAVEAILGQEREDGAPPSIILLTPQGRLFNQRIAEELAKKNRLILICGHYKGVDERVREHLVDDEISIGDYVLSGGELAAMVLVEAIVRLLPGALGSQDSLVDDSLTSGLLGPPQYTRPASFREWEVPSVLLSGNHALIARWRRQQTLLRTHQRRPDLLEKALLTEEERRWLQGLDRQPENILVS